MLVMKLAIVLLYTAALYNWTLPTHKPVSECERETPLSFSEATRSTICVAWKTEIIRYPIVLLHIIFSGQEVWDFTDISIELMFSQTFWISVMNE